LGAEPFNDDATRARDRHQTAIVEAHATFKQAVAKTQRQRNADYIAARDAFDAVKSHPDTEGYKETLAAYEQSKAPVSLSHARRAMAKAIEAADLQLKLDLVRAGQQHSVSVGLEHDPRYNPSPR
jgi:hypothetical protein